MTEFFLFLAALLSVFLLSPFVVKLLRHRLVDDICSRSSHTQPTPKGGGVVFILAVTVIWLISLFCNFVPSSYALNTLLLLSLFNALLGLIDDRFDLPFWQRLFLQVLLIVYPVTHMPLMVTFIPGFCQYLAYAFAWLWFINLFNFMDGTDGYATQETLFIMLGLFFLIPGLRPLAACLMGACLGFFRVNYPKASLFMGGVGSYYLGYLLFGLILMAVTHHPYLLLPCVTITLLFTFDATYTLIRRIIMRERFWEAHRSHWYQRLYNMRWTHARIFWSGVSINALLLLFALLSFYWKHSMVGLVLSVMLLILVASFIRFKERPVDIDNPYSSSLT